MAAVVHPAPHRHAAPRRRPVPPAERHLRLVPPPRRHPAAVYRRRQAAALVLAVVLATVLAVAAWTGARALAGALGVVPLHAPGAPAASGSPAPAGPVHVVQPGDTLWSIARALQPTGDVRPLVDRLAAANGGGALQVGQRIVLPG